MYIRITGRCNMTCEHCCSSWLPKKDMSEKVFRAALAAAANHGEYVSIGGGEPTVHPKFWLFWALAIAEKNIDGVWLATNGKKTEDAIRIAGLAGKLSEAGLFSAALSSSRDGYHDEVDPKVEKAFKAAGQEIRVVRTIFASGRAAEWGEPGCACEDLVVDPNGDVRACGCQDAPVLGNVLTGFDIGKYCHGECWKSEANNEDAA